MDKLSDFFHRFLRLSAMRELAIASVLAAGFILVLTLILWLFSENKQIVNAGDEPFYQVSPTNVKNNDAYFHKFLRNIKLNNGVLILGTSESGSLNGFNYTELLNSDPEIKTSFSAFYGAGRFCEKYIPLIAESPEEWKDLELLVFVNPTYWRDGLNESSLEYQKRYLSKCLMEKAREKLQDYDFEYLFGEVHKTLEVSKMDLMNYRIVTGFESLYYNNLNSYLNPKTEVYSDFPQKKRRVFNAKLIDSLKSLIDPDFNANPEFLEHYKGKLDFPAVDTSSYRYRALEAFMKICEKNSVHVTYVVGPYNGVMLDKLDNEKNKVDYRKLRTNILSFFKERNEKIIDLTDLSDVMHTFLDYQHHSAYGGYLIYERIKKHYE